MQLFELKGKKSVVLGGGGILGTSMAEGLAEAGADVAICDLKKEATLEVAAGIEKKYGVKAEGFGVDAMNIDSLITTCKDVMEEFNNIDILVNAVGGNMKDATTSDTQSFFELPGEAFKKVVDLNLPTLVNRKDDIPDLVGYFISMFNQRMGLNITGCSTDAIKAFKKHTWEGNIRELKNAIERGMLFCDGETIQKGDLPYEIWNK